ncbi:MAG: zf-HC2 domain-containing protein [Nitriliruptorales bacterium]|nr:zf-HC2 domain-containing protein [Nitriliruptorales bacterium]
MITCAEAVGRLWAYLERELDVAGRAQVEAHLDVCRRCCGEVEFAEELRRMLATTPPEFPRDVQHRLESFLEDLDAP